MAHLLYTLGIIVAFGAALAAIPRIWQAVKWVYWLVKRIDDLSHLGPVIVGMAQQFQRNGGSSMRDAVAAIKDDVAGVKEDISVVKSDVAGVKGQMDGQDQVLAAVIQRQDNIEKEIARLVLHEANNDLHKSRLREEMARKLGPPDAPPVDEGPQG